MDAAQFGVLSRRADALASRQLHYAALEIWYQLTAVNLSDSEQSARLYDEMGKALIQLGDAKGALNSFSKACSFQICIPSHVYYTMHLAMVQRRLAHHDKAQRMLTQLLDNASALTPRQRALVYGNLGMVQAQNGFHRDALRSTERCLGCLDSKITTLYHIKAYTNIGLHYLELGEYEQAEEFLQKAAWLGGPSYLPAIAELSRLYMLQGKWDASLDYARTALQLVWPRLMGFEKEEIARLCQILANLAFYLGEKDVAVRLIEKAQLFFGQIGSWNSWQEAQAIMDRWLTAQVTPNQVDGTQARQLHHFVVLLDALNAQEIISPEFSALLDTRVFYARALAESLPTDTAASDTGEGSVSDAERHLVYACRFADYGLTAIEPDVIAAPHRSASAWAQYQQHPALSVRMLQMAELPSGITDIIINHHERYDGTGYPSGRPGDEIPPLAQVLAVADAYALRVLNHRAPHSDALRQLEMGRGTEFSPKMLDSFKALFEV